MDLKYLLLYILIFSELARICLSACNRKPQGANGDPSPVDANFHMLIDGNPSHYINGQRYNLSLSSTNGLKFISFTLVVEPDSYALTLPDSNMLGHFAIINTAETKFNALCENMVESTNANVKSRVDISWIAPTSPYSTCVVFKVAFLQHRHVWFIDDGGLSKRLCPEEIDEINSQTPPVNPCCACDEAKYEIILERKWMRNTHAKQFPSEAWRTRFGELLGASHTLEYRFWQYGGLASAGLKELAEHGSTKALEREIKETASAGEIRTIIKAPGIGYRQNSIATTMATVRVDAKHHILSLVAKIEPSPDWILGVAGLELCLANCTWITEKTLNLYPWDVGTDAGSSYMSPDQPQIPPDVIRRITSSYPRDYRSPFFDESGAPMKSLAILYINRKKIYEKDCSYNKNVALECSTHPWNNWTDCTSKCGPGTQYRIRDYKDPELAKNYKCHQVLRQNQNCIGNRCGLTYSSDMTGITECELTEWSNWTECSKKCGRGYQKRLREYISGHNKERCQNDIRQELQETRRCYGQNCGGSINTSFDDIYSEPYEPQDIEEIYEIAKLNRKLVKTQASPKVGLRSESNSLRSLNIYNSTKDDNDFGQDLVVQTENVTRKQNAKESTQYLIANITTTRKQNNSLNNMLPDYCMERPVAAKAFCNKNRVIVQNFWFYDADDIQCKLFTADNCDTNRNKFRKLEICEEKCLKRHINERGQNQIFARKCNRYPSNTFAAKSPVDDNYAILISGNPNTYILGQSYNISLQSYNGQRFLSAKVTLENDQGVKSAYEDLGRFNIVDSVATRYSTDCINMIETTNTNPKKRLDVEWIAPSTVGMGCILIRATVLQHRDVWFMDDGGLTKRICEEVIDDLESQKKDLEERLCCACDEARYEITFEGLWSRNLHPKDFPNRLWTVRFSDVVGASHTSDYRFWDVGALATNAMREFVEHGSTRVSGLELCLANCTWLEEKQINLYPWDAGTDAGPTYTSADQPQVPPDVIRRMRSDFPSDARSPFYDETGAPMKPLASLRIHRKRIYERNCKDKESDNAENLPRECLTHPWSKWSKCSVECGEGFQDRSRVYKQEEMAKIYNCDAMVATRQERSCQGTNCDNLPLTKTGSYAFRKTSFTETDSKDNFLASTERTRSGKCEIGAWSPWSQCNKACGEGIMIRRRYYLNSEEEEECPRSRFLKLVEYKKCFGRNCLGEVHQSFETLENNNESGEEENAANYDNPVEYDEYKDSNLNSNYNDFGAYLESANLLRANSDEEQQGSPKNALWDAEGRRKLQYGFDQKYPRDHIIPQFCYKTLKNFKCSDPTVIKNYWFYNVCTDQCMLFAADICDRNLNRFQSMENCEKVCQKPIHKMGPHYLKLKQDMACSSPTRKWWRISKRKPY
uniref:Spondin-1 n=1 Tax=Glossina pallidipes TaxID=7398 RepID=A0A1A9ZR78_GLOPL